MFNKYFAGINHHDYSAAISVFDPNGSFSPDNPSNLQALANGLATTSDSHIVLAWIGPAGGGPATEAKVSFRSHQSAGYGPRGSPDETCTAWDLTYFLAHSDGRYLIEKTKGAHSGC
jgi:hypothetical protein